MCKESKIDNISNIKKNYIKQQGQERDDLKCLFKALVESNQTFYSKSWKLNSCFFFTKQALNLCWYEIYAEKERNIIDSQWCRYFEGLYNSIKSEKNARDSSVNIIYFLKFCKCLFQ